MQFLRQHIQFVILLALFTITGLIHLAVMPVLEGPDEMLHQNYVNLLRATNALPDRQQARELSTQQASGQAPLTYWIAARGYDLLGIPRFDGDVQFDLVDARNHWSAPPNPLNARDNANLYFHGYSEEAFTYPDVLLQNRIARVLSLLYSIIAVIGAYNAGLEFFGQRGWATLAAAIFALMPQMLHMSSILTNDVSATCFATLIIWQTLCILRRGATLPRLLATGVLLGLAGLSKVNAGVVIPGVVLALFLDWRSRRYSIGKFVLNGGALLLPALLIFGPWVWWGLTRYNDPFGFKTHEFLATQSWSPRTANLPELIQGIPELGYSYLGTFGSTLFHMESAVYVALASIFILAIIGFIYRPRPQDRIVAQQIAVLTLTVILGVALLLYWIWINFSVGGITGRLMYPAHGAVSLLLAYGLSKLPLRSAVQVYTLGVLVTASVIVAPLTIARTFAPPPLLSREQLPELKGGPIDFDQTIRFLGFTQPDDTIRDGETQVVILCWEVLRKPARPGAFSLKFFTQDGQTVGDRTSVHGMGTYSSALWQPSDIFCDQVGVRVGDVTPGTTYNMVLVMLDARTTQVDWVATLSDGTPIQYPFLTQLTGVE